MAVLITMPKLSDTMEEGGVASWMKEVGEFVEDGEALVEIETDKATMEYASPEEGHLLEILVKPGQGVALDAPICVLGEKGESYDLAKLISENGATSEKSDKTSDAKPDESVSQAASPAPATKETASHRAPGPKAAEAAEAAETGSLDRLKASPLAKKIAASKNIPLSSVQGSGPNGRIVRRDLDGLSASSVQQVGAPARADKKVPLSMMRKTIAKRLLAGKNDAPHFYLTVSANMEKMLAFRERLNADVGKVEGLPKVSVNDLIMQAAGKALFLHPTVNASWQDDHILEHGAVNICMAVALPSGLVTPVIRNIDTLGVREISLLAKAAGKKARDGLIENSDLSGGTFTISNLGMTGVEEFTAIINPPQAAILAVGKTSLVPHVNTQGEVTAQNRMKMTLSCDHRVIDGMVGANFLKTLTDFIENPEMMLA